MITLKEVAGYARNPLLLRCITFAFVVPFLNLSTLTAANLVAFHNVYKCYRRGKSSQYPVGALWTSGSPSKFKHSCSPVLPSPLYVWMIHRVTYHLNMKLHSYTARICLIKCSLYLSYPQTLTVKSKLHTKYYSVSISFYS